MKRKRSQEGSTEAAAAGLNEDDTTRGDYNADGSWTTERDRPPFRGASSDLYWFVASLVTKRRRSPQTPPAEFAAHIAKSRFMAAFPSSQPGAFLKDNREDLRMDWASMTVKSVGGNDVPAPWWAAAARTSAEAAVLFAGFGSNGKDLETLFTAEADLRPELPRNFDGFERIVGEMASVPTVRDF